MQKDARGLNMGQTYLPPYVGLVGQFFFKPRLAESEILFLRAAA